MSHDQLFKLALRTFFADFLRLFFPAEAAQLDLSEVRFLDGETFTDVPDGKVRKADVVAEVRTLAGETEVILVHLEIQSERRSEVFFRMFEYYALLRIRHRHRVFPIVLYLVPGTKAGITTEQYNEGVLGRTLLRFEYAAVGLPDVDATDYEESDSPLAVSLSALMRSQKRDRTERNLRARLRLIRDSRLDPARKSLLIEIVERYLPLSEAEVREMDDIATQEEKLELANFVSMYERQGMERGIEKGIQQGIQQGIQKGVAEGLLQGERRTLIRVLRARFGELPDPLIARIEAMSEPELESLTDRILTAETLEDLFPPANGNA